MTYGDDIRGGYSHSHGASVSLPQFADSVQDKRTRSQQFKMEEPQMESTVVVAAEAGDAMTTDEVPTKAAVVPPPLAPFYDPVDDDKNEEWALKQRQGRKSDAVLTCPACLTTLCIDCQRHELYVNQYRAMFVRNCTVVETERLRYSDSKKRKRNARRRSRVQEEDVPVGGPGMVRIDPKDVRVGEEVFKPVKCAECGVEVAVLDGDEVYHFFDAIPTFS